MSQRLVLIDDTDPSIQYSGPEWFEAQNTHTDTGDYGPPFQNTLHGVNVSASFSFSFSGSSVTVLGTSVADASGTQDPTWECFVDNTSIGSETVLEAFAENNWVLCRNGQLQLQDGPHVLRLQATVSKQTFWFDEIRYLPSSNVPLDQALLLIDSGDSAIQYSSGWQALHDIVNSTQTAGATLTYDFSGISISWVGYTPGSPSFNSSLATYSIDGETPTSFLVPALSSAGAYNQILFQAENLSVGNHKLVVTYQGNSGTAPLALDYFVLRNAPSLSKSSTGTATSISTSTSTSSSTSTSTASSGVSSGTSSNSMSSQTSKKSPIGAIVGGVLGGVIFLLVLFFIRRRRNRKALRLSKSNIGSDLDAFHDTVEPFTLTPPHPTPAFRSPQIINSKSSQSAPNNMASTSSQMAFPTSVPDVGLPALLSFHNHSPPATISSSSPAAPSSSSSGGLHLASSQTNLADGIMTREARETETGSSALRGGEASFVRHEDSGVRTPPPEEGIAELPPMYTAG